METHAALGFVFRRRACIFYVAWRLSPSKRGVPLRDGTVNSGRKTHCSPNAPRKTRDHQVGQQAARGHALNSSRSNSPAGTPDRTESKVEDLDARQEGRDIRAAGRVHADVLREARAPSYVAERRQAEGEGRCRRDRHVRQRRVRDWRAAAPSEDRRQGAHDGPMPGLADPTKALGLEVRSDGQGLTCAASALRRSRTTASRVADHEPARTIATRLDAHLRAELLGEFGLEARRVAWLHLRGCARAARLAGLSSVNTSRSVSRTDSLPVHHARRRRRLLRGRQREQRARVAHLDRAAQQVLLRRLRELRQAQQVGDRAARAADRLGRRFMRQAEFIDQTMQAVGLLERVQIFALDVLDQRQRQRLLVRDLSTNAGTPRVLRCATRASAARRRRFRSGRPRSAAPVSAASRPGSRIDSASSFSVVLVHACPRLILARLMRSIGRLQALRRSAPSFPPASSASRPRPSPLCLVMLCLCLYAARRRRSTRFSGAASRRPERDTPARPSNAVRA